MNKQTFAMLNRLTGIGISTEDAYSLRRIAMTLHRWHELECGDGNDYGSWSIERIPVTAKRLRKLSSPAQSPRYTMTIPRGTECKHISGGWVVADTSKVVGSSDHDLTHYYVWLDDSDVIELPYMVRHHYMHGKGKDYTSKTRIADKERGAFKRLKTIMSRYPELQAYVQTDPRGAALYVLRNGDIPQGAAVDSCYNRGIAVHA